MQLLLAAFLLLPPPTDAPALKAVGRLVDQAVALQVLSLVAQGLEGHLGEEEGESVRERGRQVRGQPRNAVRRYGITAQSKSFVV